LNPQALQPIVQRSDPVPEVLPEILLLAGDPNSNAPSILANGLWIKYRTSSDWAWKVWDNTVASLRQIPSMTQDVDARRACALRYGCFLWRIDQHLPRGLDGDVLQWFLGPGKSEVVALSADAWDVLSVVLLYLVVNDALKTTTIMEGLVYPAWQLGAAGTSDQVHVLETYLYAANKLCSHLLLQDDGGNNSMPPIDLSEAQSIRTRCQAVYDKPHFPLLVASIPTLISLENNQDVPEALRNESTSLRCRLCQGSGFRQGAYRNLDLIREAFESSPYLIDSYPSSESLSKRTVAGLRMILCDSREGIGHSYLSLIQASGLKKSHVLLDANIYDWPEVTCLLSPWKIAATTIQMQLQLKQLGRAISQESTREAASASLDRLTSMLFYHTKTSEEASYVGEMARGADNIVASRASCCNLVSQC
jgi:mediator of RNA polymerase II transcription subunit 12